MTDIWSVEKIFNLIPTVPNFPKPGIQFKDITPVLNEPKAFGSMISHLANSMNEPFDKIVAIESRGFILGSALAHSLKKGLVLVRKPGKLPRQTVKKTYALEYGQDSLELHIDDLNPGDRVYIIDDVLATGGTAETAEHLCENVGAKVIGHRFIMEIEFLQGRKKLKAQSQSLARI